MDCSVSNFHVDEWLLLSENISDCFKMPYSLNDMMSQLLPSSPLQNRQVFCQKR